MLLKLLIKVLKQYCFKIRILIPVEHWQVFSIGNIVRCLMFMPELNKTS